MTWPDTASQMLHSQRFGGEVGLRMCGERERERQRETERERERERESIWENVSESCKIICGSDLLAEYLVVGFIFYPICTAGRSVYTAISLCNTSWYWALNGSQSWYWIPWGGSSWRLNYICSLPKVAHQNLLCWKLGNDSACDQTKTRVSAIMDYGLCQRSAVS